LFVVPAGFLALALAGVCRALVRVRSEPFGLLAVGHWGFLLILRALPHTPGHDGVRQFLPAFGVLALVAGLGAATVCDRLTRVGRPLILAALVEGALSVALLMPCAPVVLQPARGGLPCAARLGMEPTYYWDALTGDALDWLNAHSDGKDKVVFATNPTSCATCGAPAGCARGACRPIGAQWPGTSCRTVRGNSRRNNAF